MGTRRVVFGKVGLSDFVLRASLPGFDVITDDMDDSAKCSFNTDWNLGSQPIVGVVAVGKFVMPSNATNNIINFPYPVPSGISIPFIDLCMVDGSGNVRDDWEDDSIFTSFAQSGADGINFISGNMTVGRTVSNTGVPQVKNIGCFIQFIVYNQPAF